MVILIELAKVGIEEFVLRKKIRKARERYEALERKVSALEKAQIPERRVLEMTMEVANNSETELTAVAQTTELFHIPATQISRKVLPKVVKPVEFLLILICLRSSVDSLIFF